MELGRVKVAVRLISRVWSIVYNGQRQVVGTDMIRVPKDPRPRWNIKLRLPLDYRFSDRKDILTLLATTDRKKSRSLFRYVCSYLGERVI